MHTTTHVTTRKGGPYDDFYAPLYDELWSNNPVWQAEVRFHTQTIGELLKKGRNWLDVGCGTGYLLSQYSNIDRTGLDFSSSMIKEAVKNNPGVNFIEQSMLEQNPSLDGVYDLVTCTGQPWSYLSNFEEIERSVQNLASWTSRDGICMLTPIDMSDMVEMQLPRVYDLTQVPNQTSLIRGIWWTYKELDTVYHNCLLPNIDEWVRWFSIYFKKVEILYWPHEPAEMIQPKRAVICSQKREVGDTSPVEIVEHPRPPKPGPFVSPLNYVPSKYLLMEVLGRLKSGRFAKAVFDKLLTGK